MNKQELATLKKIKFNLPFFARNFLKIKTKDARIVPFVLNQSQEYFHNKCEEQLRKKGRVRIVVVKGRQSGISTYVAARFYHKTSMNYALNTFILSHESKTTQKLFQMVKLYQDNNKIAPPSKRSNANELVFEGLNSQYYVGTAGSGEVGRGGTVQLFHGSEVAMWSNTDDIETGLLESIPDMDGTESILESTAKGLGNYFYRMAMGALKGVNGYELVFIPWFWMDEYEESPDGDFVLSDDEIEYSKVYLSNYDEETQRRKLQWRRNKINRFGSDWKFKQEYPSNVTEAFQTSSDSLIKAHYVVSARQRSRLVGNNAPLVFGVDPARNKDRAAIVMRRGREIEQIITYEETGDDMWFADKVASLIDKYEPIAVNIDCTNSWAIHDYLKRKGYVNTNGFHFGESATDSVTYANKRAEMWCNLRDWMQLPDVVVPDSDELHADLTSVPDYDETDGKIRLAKKEDIKKEMGFSPDIGDACALTFATRIRDGAALNVRNKNAGLKTKARFQKAGKVGLGR